MFRPVETSSGTWQANLRKEGNLWPRDKLPEEAARSPSLLSSTVAVKQRELGAAFFRCICTDEMGVVIFGVSLSMRGDRGSKLEIFDMALKRSCKDLGGRAGERERRLAR